MRAPVYGDARHMSVLRVVAAVALVSACSRSPVERSNPGGEEARFEADRRPGPVIEAMRIGPGSKVADIGAGTGLFTVHIARAVAPTGQVIATDTSIFTLDLLQQRLAAAHLDGLVEQRVVRADVPGLEACTYRAIVPADVVDDGAPDPIEAGTYDALLLAEVDQFLPDRVAWLSTARRSLRPGGRIAITNRLQHREGARAAARKAGLIEVAMTDLTPTHFLAVYERPLLSKRSAIRSSRRSDSERMTPTH